MEQLRIALIAGGYSGEQEVSIKSQKGIRSFLEGWPYEVVCVLITKEKWCVQAQDGTEYSIDKNDFSYIDSTGTRQYFDYAYITIHGTPGENGLLTGYLDMLQIPYSCCPTPIGALTFNKFICNHYLNSFGIKSAKSIRVSNCLSVNADSMIQELGLPLFVKPNVGGSSIATSKIESKEQLIPAIELAFAEAEEVLVESLIVGTEVTCGAYKDATGIHILPITEVVPKRTFFDFDAKYNGAVDEITPARISNDMTYTIQALTGRIYDLLGASGIIRVDYIIQNDEPILLEVNTTPGMTATSFIPQQVKAAGKTVGEVLHNIISYHLNR